LPRIDVQSTIGFLAVLLLGWSATDEVYG